jgi:hypothetical protein
MCATAPLAKSTKSTTRSEKRICSLPGGAGRAAVEVSVVLWFLMSFLLHRHRYTSALARGVLTNEGDVARFRPLLVGGGQRGCCTSLLY